jgi:hypothetical protein
MACSIWGAPHHHLVRLLTTSHRGSPGNAGYDRAPWDNVLSDANSREGHAFPTIARHRGSGSLRLLRQRNACSRRRNVSKRAGARVDQRHASVGQPHARAAGPERAALRSSGVVFTRRPPRAVPGHAADPETARHYRPHQTSSRRYGCHPGCSALHGRRDREIKPRNAGPRKAIVRRTAPLCGFFFVICGLKCAAVISLL